MRKRFTKQYMQGLLDGVLYGFLNQRKLKGELVLTPEDEALHEWLSGAILAAVTSEDDDVVSVSVIPGTREVKRIPALRRRRDRRSLKG